MKKANLHIISHVVFLTLLFSFMVTFLAEGGVLQGTVKGRGGQFKKYVRVEIGGPEEKDTFTNEEGRFSVELRGGQYIVRIIQRNKSAAFKVDVPKDGVVEKTFKLKW